MHYGARDRSPICDFGFWDETIPEWHKQGLPEYVAWTTDAQVHTDEWFGMDSYQGGPWVHQGLFPSFEHKVIEDRGDHEVVQQGDGVRVLRKKYMGSIPTHLSHLLVDRESWETHYKPRLDPTNPGRYPKDWDTATAEWSDITYPEPRTCSGGSLFGWLRDWMGMENIALVPYDDPEWFEEMVDTLAESILGTLQTAFDHGAQFDACGMWEDMCYSGGPLLNPAHFKKYLAPRYRKISDLLRKHGCDVIWVDCDGKIDSLLPMWLDAGVNCMFPIEVGTWGADPVKFRKDYGKDLLMIGGFNKKVLARTPAEITQEIERLSPLVEEGGFIPLPDHRVPPDVPYKNYLHYIAEARRVWGHNINLRPAPALQSVEE